MFFFDRYVFRNIDENDLDGYDSLDLHRKDPLPELFDPMKFKQNEDTHNEILDEWLTKDDESPYVSLDAKKIRSVLHSLFQVQRSIQELANFEVKVPVSL